MSETTPVARAAVVADLEDLRRRQETLFGEARERRQELLGELARLSAFLGPLTRDELPEGVLKRRRRRAVKATPRPRKAKAEEAA